MQNEPVLTKKERRDLKKQLKAEKREKVAQKNKVKKLFTWSIGILFVGVLGFWIFKSTNNASSVPNTSLTSITEADHIKGKHEAPVTLIEYSDLQCPACAQLAPIVKRLAETYSEELLIVYRHFPLTQIHKNAFAAARATEAANRQGRFWEMHDKLFDKQNDWANSSKVEEKFARYAEEIGLDKDQFINDYKDKSLDQKIKDDEKSAYGLGVNSTPTFFLNGNELVNAGSFDDFKTLIESELEKNEEEAEQ